MNQGDGLYVNTAGQLKVQETGYMSNIGGEATFDNNGEGGLIIAGEVDNEGTSILSNYDGALSVLGKFSNVGESSSRITELSLIYPEQ